jgi:opacity protein-like surface antigen
MKKLILAGLAVAMLAVPAAASASVDVDPATGNGFVGKGDVQYTFGGLNNTQIQGLAQSVKFTSQTSESYNAVCTWTTGEGTRGEKTHDVSHKSSTEVLSSIATEARQVKGQKQITGFNLNGYGAKSEDGIVPVVGAPCPGNEGHEGVWTSVEQTDSTGPSLFVSATGYPSTLLVSPPVVAPTV